VCCFSFFVGFMSLFCFLLCCAHRGVPVLFLVVCVFTFWRLLACCLCFFWIGFMQFLCMNSYL